MKKSQKKNFLSTKAGKIIALIIAVLLIASMAMPAFAEEKATDVYMTETASVHFESRVGADESTEDLTWFLGDKELSQWKKWNMEAGDFTGDAYIQFGELPVIENGVLKADLNFGLLFDGTDLSLRRPSNIRLKYPSMIGLYDLKAVNEKTGAEYGMKINLRPYESYMSYEEMQAEIQKIKTTAAGDRFVDIQQYGTTVEGRPMYYGIVAASQAELDRYLNETTPEMLEDPAAMLSDVKAGNANHKQVMFINNIHPDEEPAVDAVVEFFKNFATKNSMTYPTTTADGQAINNTIDVKKALENYIFLFSFTQNPDGRVANTRANANGFDLNRDNGYQTQPETVAMSQLIVKFNPTMFLDYHGFVSDFLIEPCTPPHEPNYETDLQLDLMLENAHRMGRAGIAASKYEKYIIPMLDYGSGWDDATSAYTPMYAMFHGALGHTIEVPEMNQESFKAALGTGYAAVDYLMSNPSMFLENKLNYYLRGINKVDTKEADKFLVNSSGEVKGRPRGENENFFPDYYVIPMNAASQKNTNEAFAMIEYFNRNGIKLQEVKSPVEGFAVGDLVIDMAQAKRGYANHVLYKGVDESEWDEMYAEIVMDMPDLRGFDVSEVRNPGLFDKKLGAVSWTKAPGSEIGENEYYLLKNNSNQAVQAVNEAIANGNDVWMTTVSGMGQGFVLDKETLNSLSSKYALQFEPINSAPSGKKLDSVKVFVDGSSALKIVAKELGLQIAESVEAADVVITDSGSMDPELVGTKPLIAIGGQALSAIAESGKIEGLEVTTTDFYHEGLLKANIMTNNQLASGYNSEDIFYTVSGTWIEKYPSAMQPVIVAQNNKDFFMAGWWPGHDAAMGKTMAVRGYVQEQPTVLFAGNLTNKLHTRYLYRWLSNAVYVVQ